MSIVGWLMNQMFKAMPAGSMDGTGDLEAQRKANESRKPPKKPKDVELLETEINSLPAEIITKSGNTKGTVFYIHGGGFTTGSAKERRYFTQYLADKCGYDVIAVNYRLAPESRWPAQADDVLAAYKEVLGKGYNADKIVFMGESAGATLVFSLAFMARDSGLPLPKAIIALSPPTDYFSDLPSHTANIATDYMLRDAVANGITEPMFGGQASPEELKDPLLSPINGDFTGLPPVFLSVSDTEVLYDDSVIMYEKLKREGHPVELDVQHAQIHSFQVLPFIPEAKKTIDKVMRFMDRI